MNSTTLTPPVAAEKADMHSLMKVIRTMVGEMHPKWRHIRFLPDSHLERDLGLDSLARLELRQRIEQHFAVQLAEKTAVSCVTPAELLRAIHARATGDDLDAGVAVCLPGTGNDSDDLLLGAFGRDLVADQVRGGHSVAQWLYALYAWPVLVVIGVLTGLLVVFAPLQTWRNRIARAGARLLFKASFTPLIVQGREHLDRERPQVLVSNHASYLDGFALTAALDIPFHFIVKGELSRILPIRLILQRFGVEFIDRFNPHKSARDVRRMAHRARKGDTLLFFPEGTFITFPGLQPFRMGAFVTAARSSRPVVPIGIKGTREMVRGSDWFPLRGRVTVIIRPPVLPTGESWQDALALRDATRREIAAHCGEPDLVLEASLQETAAGGDSG
jgi:1-acyl-sn-glycerol-3-phosphate acyltransferase